MAPALSGRVPTSVLYVEGCWEGGTSMGASLLREGVLRVPWEDGEWLPGRRGRVAWKTGSACVQAAPGLLFPLPSFWGRVRPGVHRAPPRPVA